MIHLPAGDADLSERVILEAASMMPLYLINFVLLGVSYLMFIFGAYPSASPERGFSFMFLRAHTTMNFMSIFARFMYV